MSDFSGIGPNGVPQFVGMADEFVSFEDLPETTRTYVAASSNICDLCTPRTS
jgi:hypothetical protein